jgi:hypothetical protein
MSDITYSWCERCRNNFPLRTSKYDALELSGETFYCDVGHPLFITRKSVVSRMRGAGRSSDRKSRTIDRLMKSLESQRGVATRCRNRLVRGCCPYCGILMDNICRHVKLYHNFKSK